MAVLGDSGDRGALEKKAKAEGRLPPGQSLTLKWPVLHYGNVPHFAAASWDFKISGLVEEPKRLTWEEFHALPQTDVTSDFHCVTRWSRLDNRWTGVLFTEVMKLATPKPGARFALVRGENGYTANLPLEDLSSFARGHASDDVRPIFHAAFGVEGPGTAGDTLDQEPRVIINKNRHWL